jgi:hypothetical protein
MEDPMEVDPPPAAASTLPKEVNVIGHAWGCSGSYGVKFRVIKSEDTEVEAYTLPHMGAPQGGSLPFAQPSVMYRLTLREPTRGPSANGSYAAVMRVHSCVPNKAMLAKKMLLQYLVAKKGLTMQDEYAGALKKMLKGVPSQLTPTPEEISLERLQGRRWLHAILHECLGPLLRPAGSPFFSLLRYFPGSWLLRFNEEQLAAMLALVKRAPQSFCFWDKAVRVLSQSRRSSPSSPFLFDAAARKELAVHPRHASQPFLVQQILSAPSPSQGEPPLYFSVAYPVWSLLKLQYAVLDHLVDSLLEWVAPPKEESTRLAIRLYLWGEQEFYRRGTTSISLHQACYSLKLPKPHDPSSAEGEITRLREALQFLDTVSNVLVPSEVPPVVSRASRLPSDRYLRLDREQEEMNLLDALRTRVLSCRLVQCPYYNARYLAKLRDAASKPTTAGRSVIVCANLNFTAYVRSQLSGLEVVCVDNLVAHYLRERRGGGAASVVPGYHKILELAAEPLLLLDRVHKMSPRFLCALLNCLPEGRRVHLLALGDQRESGASYVRGGGNLMVDLARAYPVETWEDWGGVGGSPPDPMCDVYRRLENVNTAKLNVGDHRRLDPMAWKACTREVEKAREATKKKKAAAAASAVHGFQVFCSTEHDRTLVETKVFGRDAKVAAYCFDVGSRVRVPERDLVGTLEMAWEFNEGVQGEVMSGKQLDLRKSTYQVRVASLLFNTRDVTLEHADVMLASQYAGPPVERGLFFVDANVTTRNQLLGCVKYCLSHMQFFVDVETSLSRVLEKKTRGWTTETDLGNKLAYLKNDLT